MCYRVAGGNPPGFRHASPGTLPVGWFIPLVLHPLVNNMGTRLQHFNHIILTGIKITARSMPLGLHRGQIWQLFDNYGYI